jgi:hypothetical protein
MDVVELCQILLKLCCQQNFFDEVLGEFEQVADPVWQRMKQFHELNSKQNLVQKFRKHRNYSLSNYYSAA